VICALAWLLYAPLWQTVPGQDFMVFFTGARAYLEGHQSLIFDGNGFNAQLNERFAGWLGRPLGPHPWVYPPLFLLLVVPLGLLPAPVAYVLFLAASFALLIWTIRCYVPAGWKWWLCVVSLLLSPATAFTVVTGQNGFLVTALLIGGFGLAQRRPLIAGALLGVLTSKPQLWLLVPVALIAMREWRVLAAAVASAGVLTIASVAVFGIDAWQQWIMVMLRPSPLYQQFLEFGRLNDQSVYTEAFLLGAPAVLASAVQAIGTFACATLVWWCFRLSGMRRDMQLAVLLTAVILAAPHVANYDAVMAVFAVTLFFCRTLTDGFRFGDAVIIITGWSVEILNPPHVIRSGLITPFVYCVFLAAIIARGRADLSAVAAPGAAGRRALPGAVGQPP
jgi:hypothetical protein